MAIKRDKNIGFIGTGVMGASMAGHLLAAGYNLRVYNRTREKAQGLLEAGAQWATPEELARSSDAIITIVGYPQDVETLYLAPDGLVANARPGTLLVDMTTSRPDLAQRIAREAAGRGSVALDAPVSGGDRGAREGTLSIMCGGDETAFDRALPLFECMGKNIQLQGDAGAGQHTKMANQIAVASTMLGACEALAYAKKAELDAEKVLGTIASGAAGSWTLNNLAPRILQEDFAPGFYVKHFIKDLGIAIESAEQIQADLPGLKLAKELYERLAKQGHNNLGTQALFKLYQPNG